MKKLITLMVLVSLTFFSTAYAEMTPVNAKLLKEWNKGEASFSLRDDNGRRDYEDEQIKIHIQDALFMWSKRGAIGNTRKAFVQSHSDSIYHAVQAALGGYVQWLSATAAIVDITNKTNEVLCLDLDKTIVSIGSYKGRAAIDLAQFADNPYAKIPPENIMPGQTITMTLCRGDAVYVEDENYGSGWVVPSDLSLGKNIFGDGTFIFAIGGERAKLFPMKFYCEIDRDSIAQYITKK